AIAGGLVKGMSMIRESCVALVVGCLTAALAWPAGAAEPPKVNPKAAELKEFSDRVAKYVELHKKADGDVPSLKRTDDPAEIASREKLLGEAIRAARKDAKVGDIFTPA